MSDPDPHNDIAGPQSDPVSEDFGSRAPILKGPEPAPPSYRLVWYLMGATAILLGLIRYSVPTMLEDRGGGRSSVMGNTAAQPDDEERPKPIERERVEPKAPSALNLPAYDSRTPGVPTMMSSAKPFFGGTPEAGAAISSFSKKEFKKCSDTLDAFEKKGGFLTPDLRLLRMEALAKQGKSARVRELATRFLEDSPSAPQADRVRQLQVSP